MIIPFLLFILLLILIMNKKYCKTIKGKKRCTNFKPQMNARDIVKIQMNALQNNKNDSGIRAAYKYASKENKKSTGPYERFKKMLKNKNYKHLLNCKRWKFIPYSTIRKNDEFYSVDIEVYSSYDNEIYIYTLNLSRQIKTLFWRTDSVLLKEGYLDYSFINNKKKKSNKDQNVLNSELQICSTDPMTGWHRSGKCTTDENDHGTHTVCSKMTDEFLEYTKKQGNDLSTPKGNFPGLKKNDQWCLCSSRWKEAKNAGKAPPVILDASHVNTLKNNITLDELKSYNQMYSS